MPQPERGEAHNHPGQGIKERAQGYSWGQRHERESGTRHVTALGDEATQKGILQNLLRQSFQDSGGIKKRPELSRVTCVCIGLINRLFSVS